MRKRLFLAMSAVVLLAGCSKENDDLTNESGNGSSNTENIDPDAVKIHLGMKLPFAEVNPSSRAVVDNTTWNGTRVGIFALGKNPTFGGAELTWVNNNLSQRILDNKEGIIATGANPSVTLDGDYFYPMTQGMNFTFYGYYPKVDDTAITTAIDGKKIDATYQISGQEDILWGRAVAPTLTNTGVDYEGYNARYFRKNTTAVDPSIEFNHKLVRLNFKLKAGAEDPVESAKVKVTSISVVCQNRKVNLTIADKTKMNDTTTPENGALTSAPVDGSPVFVKDGPDPVFLLPLYKLYTSPTTNEVYTGYPTEASAISPIAIGLPIMLPTTNLAITSTPAEVAYYIKVELEASANQTLSTIVPVTTTGGFLAGYQYDVTIVVNGLNPIRINATLKEWAQGNNPGDVEIN